MAGGGETVEDGALDVLIRFGGVALRQFRASAEGPEHLQGFAAEIEVGFGLRRSQQALFVAADHEAAEDAA